ncbi:MAG: hypothetical protein NVS4B2_33180 [Chloroflexota bacterium]
MTVLRRIRVRNLEVPFDPEFSDWTGELEDGRRVYVTWRVGEIRVQATSDEAPGTW